MLVKQSDFKIEMGEPSWFERPADRGHAMRRGFCATCGSPLFLINGAGEGAIVIYAGSLDDPSWYAPSRDIFVKSAQSGFGTMAACASGELCAAWVAEAKLPSYSHAFSLARENDAVLMRTLHESAKGVL